MEANYRLAKIPTVACDCGKPVVFVNGRKKFHCTRCGTNWKLIVGVEKAMGKAASR